MASREEQATALDVRIAEITAAIAQAEGVLYDPETQPAKVAAAERYLEGARRALSSAQAARARLG